MKRIVLGAGVLAIFVAALWIGWTFRAGNAGRVDLDLIWLKPTDVELWWVLLLAIGLGALLAGVVIGFAWLQARLLNRRYRARLRRLEKEVHELRSLPLVGAEPGGGELVEPEPVVAAATAADRS